MAMKQVHPQHYHSCNLSFCGVFGGGTINEGLVALLGHFADGLQLLVRATLRVLICTRLN
jgi:hypothetical protein